MFTVCAFTVEVLSASHWSAAACPRARILSGLGEEVGRQHRSEVASFFSSVAEETKLLVDDP